MKPRITIVALLLNFICLSLFAQTPPLVYSAENTGASFAKPPLPTKDKLPRIEPLPDPFVFATPGKGRSTSFSDWEYRRNEIKAQIENYEIGFKPPRPDTIKANFTPAPNGGLLTVEVIRNAKVLTLYSHISLPSAGSGPFPAVIGIALANGTGASTGSVPSNLFTDRSVATIEYVHDQVTQYAAGVQVNHAGDPFFLLYPEYTCPGNTGQYAAWVWGVSRLIDGIEIVQKSSPFILPIDLKHLAITGCSYAGKMALYSGAFDERIALTIAQESGGGGAPSWRVNQTRPNGTVEKIDNTDYSWFSPERMRQFRGDSVYYLPHDHHELMAMVAPRALLETGNTDFTWLGNPANYVDAMATKEIYKTLGISDRFGFFIDGAHGHCSMPATQFPAVTAFIDKFLLGKMDVNTDTVMTRPKTAEFDTVDYARWYNWWGTGNPVFDSKPVVAKGQNFTINDKVQNGAVVGTVTATDKDPNTTLQGWKITGGTGAQLFAINSTTGEITVSNRSLLDFNNVSNYTLLVSVGDGIVNSDPAVVTINLAHVPVVTLAQAIYIDNWITDATIIGKVTATDKDPNTTLQDWKITGGTGAAVFVVNPATGELKASNPTVVNSGNPSTYKLTLTVSDGQYTSDPATVNIAISDKVYVCHFGTSIYISRADVPKHLSHGDQTGVCPTGNIVSNGPNRLTETPGNSLIRVYPNPVRDAINVDLGANTQRINLIQVVDMTGKVVKQVKVSGESRLNIARENLKPGMYLLRMQGEKLTEQKVVVQ